MHSAPPKFSLRCPTCDAELNARHPSNRGLLINEIASLNSRLITQREQLSVLEKKAFARFQEQRDQDLVTKETLKQRIEDDERTLKILKLVNEESHGSGHQPPR